nr:signal recognition particle subunit SRP72-like [Ipomoea batatas]
MAPKPKPKPSTAAAPAVSLEDLFTTLNRHIERSEYQQAVKVADQILAAAPGDEDAIRCKIVALIKDDSVDEALASIQDSSKKTSIDFTFFKAYCLYRQNKLDEALETLKGQEENSEKMLLECQILYRLGKADECVDIYHKLQRSKIDSLEINIVAALVSAGRAPEVQGILDSLRVKPTSSFELAFNTACSLIERQKYKDAEQLLLSARRIGQESLMEENLADEDIEMELAPIAVQLAFVQQILGNREEALESYIGLIKRNLADDSSLAVAINNLIALKGPKDVSDSLRKIDKLIEKNDGPLRFQLARGLDLKLSPKQREAIYTNWVLLLLHSNKMDQARELVAALPRIFPDSIIPLLLQAAVHVRENKAAKAEEVLGQFAEKFPNKSKVVLLARAQVAAAAGHHQVAADSLGKLSDIQHKPATVATLVTLKERAGDIDGADLVFNAAIEWWSNAMTEDNKLDIIMQEAAAFKLRHGRKEEAARLYEKLVKSHGSIEALVGLIQTTAQSDVEKAEAYEKQLKPLPGLKAVDIDSLEKTSGAKGVGSGPTLSVAEAYETKSKEKPKKKRKRKPRYPKGFDPANPGPPPDPERWLPKRERSSYRPKRKDKRAAQIRGSQGAVAKEASSSSTSKPNPTANPKGASQNSNADQPKTSKSSKKKSRK